jgi:DNA gyrase subunit A
MGVRLMNLASGDSVVAIARNAESLAESETGAEDESETGAEDESETGAEDESGSPDAVGNPGRGDPETGPGSAAPGPPGDDSGLSG